MADLDDLPYNPTLGAIEMLIGAEYAALISMELGGRRVHIPKRSGAHSVLAVCVGLDNAQKISQIYGGMHFDVPVGLGKKAEVMKLTNEGWSAADIARRVRCSIRYVYAIRDAMNNNQTSLPF